MFKFWSVCRLVNGRPTIGYNSKICETPYPKKRFLFHKSTQMGALYEPFCTGPGGIYEPPV
jgi:hypothetical protein